MAFFQPGVRMDTGRTTGTPCITPIVFPPQIVVCLLVDIEKCNPLCFS